jgi:Tubulin like
MNHFVIGLGGTGGKIIRALRKTLYQEFHGKTPADLSIGYLYVDSSNEMMGIDDPSWKTLGTSVQLPKASQLLITDANLTDRLDNLDSYPGLKHWLGSPQEWRDILNSIVGATLGGQKRRLGRFLFACKADKFREQVQTQVKLVQNNGITEVTFHVIVGLAGGTGSGSVVDAVAQLRDLYPDSKRYRILIYALLPDAYPHPNWDTGNYHANGYAALTELNAMSVGAYEPYDVMGVKDRLKLSDPFNGCYVFSNENENGLTMDVDRDLPSIVGDFLYQKIVAVKNLSWSSLGRMENAENGDGSPETAPQARIPERSKRFLAFGIKRLAIPEEEIGEFLTYSFARQAALQLRFNHWQAASGFIEEPRSQDFHEFVQQKETEARWLISDDHLTLALGILAEDANNKKWKSFTGEWEAVIPNFKSLVRERERATWLDELTKLCEKRYQDDYRTLGVPGFYRTKLKARKEMAREIRLRVEQELINEWKVGAKSTWDIARLLVALLEKLEERLKSCDEKISRARHAEEEAQSRVLGNAQKWASMGLLSKHVLGTPDSLLDAHGVYLQEMYVYRTRAEGWAFAKALLIEVVAEITDLKGEVDRTTNTLQQALKKFEVGIQARLTDTGSGDLRQHLIRFYEPEQVRAVGRRMVLDEAEQKTQTSRVRAALAEKAGVETSFGLFNQRVSEQTFLDVLETVCEENARIAHQNLVQSAKDRLLGVSIIEKLRDRYGSDPQALKSYVTELVNRAGNFISLDPMEVQRAAPGVPVGVPTAVHKFTAILPKAPEQAEFSAALKAALREAKSGDVEIIESDGRPHEITLVSITNLFPLRYLKPLKLLEEKYRRRVDTGGARARLELHTEGDGNAWPRLFVASSAEVKLEALPYLLLAKVLGYIHEGRNPATGMDEVLLVTKDADGFDNDPVNLGKTFASSADSVGLADLHTIKTVCDAALTSTDYLHQDKRAELRRAVLAEVEAVKAARGGNVQDDLYRRFLDAGRRAAALLKGDAT